MPVTPHKINKSKLILDSFKRFGFHHPVIHSKFLEYETKQYFEHKNYYYCYTRIDDKIFEIKFWFVSARVSVTYDPNQFILKHSTELQNV